MHSLTETISERTSFRWVAYGFVAAILLSMLATPTILHAQPAPMSLPSFYKTLLGDWVGVCMQSTDGQQAENKYFRITIKDTGSGMFISQFTYYRSDGATGTPIQIGETTAISTVQPDGTIKNDIQGKGSILVEKKAKQQSHKLTEVLSPTGPTTFAGKIDGKISVSGLPFGVGKNGKVSNGKSAYLLNNGVLTINQTFKAAFKILLFKKSYTVTANSTARRGTDVSALMKAAHIAI